MIINIESIFKKIIFFLIKKNYKIKLTKKEIDQIQNNNSIKESYNDVIKMLIKNKRIKRNNRAYRLWINFRKRLGI